jgi:hypothetical protein
MAIIKAREVTPNRSHTGEVNVKKNGNNKHNEEPLKRHKEHQIMTMKHKKELLLMMAPHLDQCDL